MRNIGWSLNVIGALIAMALPSLAAPVSMATCNVTASMTGVLLSQTGSATCAGTDDSPAVPGTPGYTVESMVSGDLLHGSSRGTATAGIWSSSADRVFATVTGQLSDDDLVLFPGSGPGTLRMNVSYGQSTPGVGGDVAFVLDGYAQILSATSVLPQSRILDFTIPLGVVFDFSTLMQFHSNSSNGDGGHGGIRFDVQRFRLYDASGIQFSATGSGTSGRQFKAVFDPDDWMQGPILDGSAPLGITRTPEPGTMTLFLITALAVGFSFVYQKFYGG